MNDKDAWPDSATFGEYRAAYRAWKAEREQWDAEYRRLQRMAGSRRYTVGHVMGGLAFMVQGEGDTWDEAFAVARR